METFDLKPNSPGRCSHICNAGFIVQPGLRSQSIGQFMGEAMLYAFDSSKPTIKLWQSLRFDIIKSIPHMAKLADGQVVNALIKQKALKFSVALFS